jgi:phosphoglycolate phosphatase
MAIGALIFDLDGTLTDPYVGISRSYLHALDAIGRPPIGEDALRDLIGPPMQQAFARLCGDEPHLVDDAVRAYRSRYADIGLFENTVYPEIPAALAQLAQTFTLFVCTSKPRVFAVRILERFGLAEHFATIYGAELDGTRADKRELLQWVIEQESLDPATCVMIGDREFDAEAAVSTGMPFIGVLWGFGTIGELRAAGAGVFAATPLDLAREIPAAERKKRP